MGRLEPEDALLAGEQGKRMIRSMFVFYLSSDAKRYVAKSRPSRLGAAA